MIPMGRPGALWRHEPPTNLAFIAVPASVRLMVSLLVLLPLVFSIHFMIPLKSNLRFLLKAYVSL